MSRGEDEGRTRRLGLADDLNGDLRITRHVKEVVRNIS